MKCKKLNGRNKKCFCLLCTGCAKKKKFTYRKAAEVARSLKDETIEASIVKKLNNAGVLDRNYFPGNQSSHSRGKRSENDDCTQYL